MNVCSARHPMSVEYHLFTTCSWFLAGVHKSDVCHEVEISQSEALLVSNLMCTVRAEASSFVPSPGTLGNGAPRLGSSRCLLASFKACV